MTSAPQPSAQPPRLYWVFVLISLALLMLSLGSCSREAWHAPLALAAAGDSGVQASLPTGGKYKMTGPVTITIQHGQTNTATSTTTDARKAGQRHGTAATGAGSQATSKQAATPWWVFALVALAGAALGVWARGRLSFLSFI